MATTMFDGLITELKSQNAFRWINNWINWLQASKEKVKVQTTKRSIRITNSRKYTSV